MTATAQSYANHRRVFPLYHLFVLPVLITHVIVTMVASVRHPSFWNLWLVVVALGLVAGIVANRASTLIVQNRVIGLEMRLRLATVLPVELCQRIPELHLKQLVGLRYASDDELVGLVERCLRGELATADAVKREVRHWRPDYVRA
jgi:4-amino-4-deoxy-L-arabinose transferase-like glycosyltransferase